jgi:hypothetical protein
LLLAAADIPWIFWDLNDEEISMQPISVVWTSMKSLQTFLIQHRDMLIQHWTAKPGNSVNGRMF